MKICFEQDKNILVAKWSSDVTHMSVMEYMECWNTILRHVQTVKPKFLMIDASDYEYRQLFEANLVFNEISKLLTPKNIGIVINNNLLGSKTLDQLLKNCPLQGHHVFEKIQEAFCWLSAS